MRRGERKQSSLDRRPKPGTRLGDLYDALLSGDWVNAFEIGRGAKGSPRYNEDLRDFYDCELETRHPGKSKDSGGTRLLGRWDGPYFVPVERLPRD